MVQIEQWRSLDVGSTHLRALWRLKETHHMTYLLVSLIPRLPHSLRGWFREQRCLVERQTNRWLDTQATHKQMKDNGHKTQCRRLDGQTYKR